MNTLDGGLNFKVGLDNTPLAVGAAQAKATLKGIGDQAVAQGSRIDHAFSAASGVIGMMAMGGVASIGMLGNTIVETTAKFEKFGIVLRNTLGTVKGNEALNMLANFAATTPFQLDEVTAAFIKLANQGFVPTREQMVKMGDLASSTGKSFDQLAEAILDAQTNQFERLKEFGIKASANGDRVTFTFKEQKTTIENTAASIQKYILSLGDLQGITGANALISESLTGQLSNLGDKFDAMYNKIGSSNSGLIYSAIGGVSTLVENYEAVGEVVKGLIAVYGVYKVATMAIAYQENLKAAASARAIAVETAYQEILKTRLAGAAMLQTAEARTIIMQEARIAATNQVIAAEAKLAATSKAASMANIYLAAATAVAYLGYEIYKVVTAQTNLEKATEKASLEIENEKDRAAELFAALKTAKENTDEWKKAKQSILDQYGEYLTGQQKELQNAKDIAEAYATVNQEIEKNVAIRVRKDALEEVSNKYNPEIEKAKKNFLGEVKERLDRDQAAVIQQELEQYIAAQKIANTPEERKKAGEDFIKYFKDLRTKLTGDDKPGNWAYQMQLAIMTPLSAWKMESDAIKKAFDVQTKKIDDTTAKPIITTYEKQIQALKTKKATIEKELEDLKKTPGVDPMKAVIAKQGELDEINKQLGIKEKAQQEKRVKSMIELNKQFLDVQNQIIAKAKELDAALKSGDNTLALNLSGQITALQKQQADLVKTPTIKGKSATIPGTTEAVQGALKPMKQLTEEERKQLEIRSKRYGLQAQNKDLNEEEEAALKKQLELQEQIVAYALQFADAIATQLDLTEGQSQVLNGALNTLQSVGRGDYLGAAIGAFSTAMTAVLDTSGIEKKLAKPWVEFENWISRSNEALERYIKLRDESIGEDRYTTSDAAIEKARAIKDEAEALMKDAKLSWTFQDSGWFGQAYKNVTRAFEDLQEKLGGGLKMEGDIKEWGAGPYIWDKLVASYDLKQIMIDKEGKFTTARLQQLIDDGIVTDEKVIQALKDYNANLDELTRLEKEKQELLTATMAATISDSIVDGFKNGYNAASDFADNFEDLMRDAMLQSLEVQWLEKPLQDWYAKFSKFMESDGLDKTEKELLKTWYDKIITDANAEKAALFETAGIPQSSASRTGSTKGIAAMNQDSADELNGRFTAIQGHTFSINESVKILAENSGRILSHLEAIEKNTDRLEMIESDISRVKEGIDTINLKGITLKK